MAPIKSWELNADYLDGKDASEFATSAHDHAATYSVLGHTHDYSAPGHSHTALTGAVQLGGDSSNHVAIGTDGNLPLVGTSTVWDDIRVEPIIKSASAQSPSYTQWFTNGSGSRGVYLYTFDNAAEVGEKELRFALQLPHSWAQTPIYLHVHWIASTTAASSKVRWGLEYTWAEPGAVFGNTNIVYADTTKSAATGTTQYQHEITAFAALTPTSAQDGLSAILICRVFRNSSHGDDTYTGNAGMLYIDAHVELNKLGSNTEYA